MKIVLAPTEIAGQIGALCSGLREAGIEVNGYNWFHSFLNYKRDNVQTDAYELAKLIDPLLEYCDLLHFHNGNTFMTGNDDLPLIAGAGKRMIMHHWGSDVRTSQLSARLNPYPLPQGYMSDADIHQRLIRLSAHIRHAIVQDYELYPHVKDYYASVHVLPLACRVSTFRAVYPIAGPRTKPIRIVHAPTSRAFKGSDLIIKVVEDLKRTYPIEFVMVENTSHQDALRLYSTADIVVDQILCGTYGMLSVEAMAMGKPVVAYIRSDVRDRLPPTLPIVGANRDTLKPVLASLLSAPERLHHIGKASREYVMQVHDTSKVTKQLLQIYRQVMGAEGGRP